VNKHSRCQRLFEDDFKKLQKTKIIIFGVGGVGSFCLDSLYRTGIEDITIVDFDKFDITNQNRQIGSQFVDEYKTNVFKRLYPNINTINQKVTVEFIKEFDFDEYDFVVDAIDDLLPKIELIKKCHKKIISSMGSANKIDSTKIKIIDIFKTTNDPFAKKIRYELKKSGFKSKVPVVFSDELPLNKNMGSFVGVTGSFGLAISSYIIQKILSSTNLQYINCNHRCNTNN
jgi:tRNA A37 threonylcarbamoyladenosine dehydratase